MDTKTKRHIKRKSVSLCRRRNIHCNNRLNKPRLRYIEIHGQGFGQRHISKKGFRAIYWVISIAEIILQSKSTTEKPNMGTLIMVFSKSDTYHSGNNVSVVTLQRKINKGTLQKSKSVLWPKYTGFNKIILKKKSNMQTYFSTIAKVSEISLYRQTVTRISTKQWGYSDIYKSWE